MKLFSCLIIALMSATVIFAHEGAYRYTIDAQKSIGANTRFWQAIGHDFLFKLVNEPVGRETLNRMQENQSCRYFRTHYTFSNQNSNDKRAGGSVCGQVLRIDEQGKRHYDFTRVNRTFREYVRRGMRPIVEFDFFPDRMAIEFGSDVNDEQFAAKTGEPVDWAVWEELLHTFMQNLIDEFGIEEMRTWYFEVWNEPDGWPQERLDVFFRLYDEFASVVKSYDPAFRVGGPACYHIYFLRDFLDHVVNGTNAVTGQKGSPIDFISYHIYGISGGWLNPAPRITPIVQRYTIELLWIQRLLHNYDLPDVEFHLNEWGQSSNYYKGVAHYPDLVYRDDERAALFMVKLIDNLYALDDSYKFKTDLLGYWGFCWEGAQDSLFLGHRELTTGGNVPKPILTAYEMLARLGDERLAVQGPRPGGRTGLLATCTADEIQFLVYNFNEQDDDLNVSDRIEILLQNIDGQELELDEYILDREHHNTYRLWERLGRPATVNKQIKEQLLKEAEMQPDHHLHLRIKNKKLKMTVHAPRHSMRLFVGKLR